jgi:selenocysteine lyase/cysteine desulfurase
MDEKPQVRKLIEIHPKIRARFPTLEADSLGRRRIYLNTGAGSHMVDTAAEAMRSVSRTLSPMPGANCPGESATAQFHENVRALAADFLGASGPTGISFHFSATNSFFNLAYGLRGRFRTGRNIVVTDLDHMSNISPWEAVGGKLCGCEIRRARVTEDGRLDIDHLLSLIDDHTVLAASTMASNGFGTVVPLRELCQGIKAKNPECLLCIDAVHHALHGPIDVSDIGCDFLAFSGYKVFGPMLGVLWGKPEVLETCDFYRVETNKAGLPRNLEQGMLPNASLAALEAALSYLLWIADEMRPGPETAVNRSLRFRTAMEAIAEYEQDISRAVLDGFSRHDPSFFKAWGILDPEKVPERDPTFAFAVSSQESSETKKRFWRNRSIQIGDGNHYSAAVFRHLAREGVCRASFAHYDSIRTARVFLEALEEILNEA